MTSLFRSIALFWCLCLSLTVQAGIVPVREVQLNVFEKSLTGYRVSLPLDRSQLQNGIQQYFAAYPVSPLILENGIIFENFDYPAITTSRSITLYYLLNPVEDVITELTLVGLYDYQNPITVHQYPDLALRMLLDLSEMVQGLTGDPVDFDALFSRQSVSEVMRQYENRKERNFMNFYVQREGEFIGSDQGTLVRENPFGDNRPENFETEDQVVAVIQNRFKNYVAQNRSTSSPFLDPNSSQQVAYLRDSIRRMQERLLALNQVNDSLQLENQTLAQPDTVPVLAQVDTVYLTRLDSTLQASWQLATDSLLRIQDSLTLALQNQAEVAEKPVLTPTEQNRLQALEIQLAQLKQQNASLTKEAARLQQQEKELLQLQIQQNQLQDQLALRGRIINFNQVRTDSLFLVNAALARENALLNASRDSLAEELMVLNPESKAARIRREVYRRQLEQLVEAQQNQTRREQDLVRREKLVSQRERYLAEFELTGEPQALLSRIIQLQNRIKALERERDRLKSSTPDVRNLRAEIYRLKAPPGVRGYRFDPEVASAFAKEQILAWFLMRGMTPGGRIPLRFEEVILPSLAEGLLNMEFYELENDRWLLALSKADGSAIQPEDVPVEEVNKLLKEIFR
jgi:hypothetical protein